MKTKEAFLVELNQLRTLKNENKLTKFGKHRLIVFEELENLILCEVTGSLTENIEPVSLIIKQLKESENRIIKFIDKKNTFTVTKEDIANIAKWNSLG